MVPPPYLANGNADSLFSFEENYDGGAQVKHVNLVEPPRVTQAMLNALQGPMAWGSGTLKDTSTYILDLSGHVVEVENALRNFKALGLDGPEVGPDNFPLPSLQGPLKAGAITIHQGIGLFMIRGLNFAKYSAEDSTTIYLGLASHVCDKRGMQNKKGNMLTHVIDSKAWTIAKEKRHGIHRNEDLPFHTDMGCDILGLVVRQAVSEGGGLYAASAATIVKKLLAASPEVVSTLMSPTWPVQVSARNARYMLAPLIEVNDGRLMISVDSDRLGPVTGSPAAFGIPELTFAQRNALRALRGTASSVEERVPIQTGDMLFINNWALVHRREAYKDDATTTRHLVRLWLRNSELGWKVPQSMSIPWLAAYDESARYVEPKYVIEPLPEYEMVKYTSGSAAYVLYSDDEGDEE